MTIAEGSVEVLAPVTPCAVTWIGDEWASVARMSRDRVVSTSAIHRGAGTEASYLELIARVLGDAQRVVILGPTSMRLALERAYVALYHWPDRLVDVDHSDVIGEEELIDRLRALAGSDER
jgi:hypothetical protein